jgi:DNA-binding transcriptional LysR family regulator
MLSGTDFMQLRAFTVVAQARSFSRAAEALGVSSSALSQLVRSLEEQLGSRLLNRTTRSVSLTQAGENLLQRTGAGLSDLADALEEVRRAGERPAGTLRIHAFRSAAARFLEPVLASFAREYPNVVLDITADDTVADIVTGGFDAAIRIGELIERDMIAVQLGPDLHQIVVAAPDYLARHAAPETPHDLRQHRCIRWRWPGHDQPYDWEFFGEGRWFQVAVDGPLIVNSRDMERQAALAGVGLALVVEEAVAPIIADGRLVPLLRRWSAPFPGFYLCYPTRKQMAPALRAFIDAVRSSADKLPNKASEGL